MNLARTAILIALLVSAGTAAILLLSNPPPACPDWHLQNASSTSIWLMLASWTAPLIAIPCFIVIRWNWFLQKAAEGSGSVLLPAEFVLTRMCVVCAVVSQLPLLFVVDCAIR